MPDEESKGKVIPFDRFVLPLELRKNDSPCRHDRVVIDEHSRMLECRKCGQVIDAFDFVYGWAENDLRISRVRAALVKEIERLEKVLSLARKEEKNTNARIRKLRIKESGMGELFEN